MRVKIFDIESKSKRGFEKGNMHVISTIGSTTILSPIIVFEFKLVPIFLHMDSIRKIEILFKVGAILQLFSSLLV